MEAEVIEVDMSPTVFRFVADSNVDQLALMLRQVDDDGSHILQKRVLRLETTHSIRRIQDFDASFVLIATLRSKSWRMDARREREPRLITCRGVARDFIRSDPI